MIQLNLISALTAMFFFSAGVAAQTVYVTDQLQIGLHADKVADSPIVKTIPTGTPLEVIKIEERMTFVREPGGTSGWADNTYLIKDEPASNRLPQTQARMEQLEGSLSRAELKLSSVDTGSMEAFENQITLLEQQLKSERVNTAELQVELAELRKRLGQDNSNDSLYEKIDSLSVENRQLQIQLAQILEQGAPDLSTLYNNYTAGTQRYLTAGNIIIAMAIVLIAGVILGLYLMDIIIRRRHGGFRI